MRKAGLFSPFMAENFGGGERYLLTVADCLLRNPDLEVDLIVPSDRLASPQERDVLKQKYIDGFHLDLNRLSIIQGPFGPGDSLLDRWLFTRKYDYFYYMTDGSFFVSGAKRNMVHFMIPFKEFRGGVFNKLKMGLWQIKVANAYFTKQQMEKNWGIRFDFVHWGAVNKADFPVLPKKNIILNVGRFFTSSGNRHCKRQEVLVDIFKQLCDQGLKDWEFVLIGAVDKGRDNEAYAQEVMEKAKGYPITVIHNAPFPVIQKYYGEAKVYWHATGFGLDENERPEAMEHLGLTTVEAMAAGLVPVVIHKAGQKEIVTENVDGLFWDSMEECKQKTLQLIKDEKKWGELSMNAQKRADAFSKEEFCKMTSEIFDL